MIYQTIFNELTKIINIETLKRLEHLKFKSSGFMDLNFDFLRVDNQNRYVIAISHYYKQNGDMIADPDMELRIDNSWDTPTCEALTFQDRNGYQEVYPIINNEEITLEDINFLDKKSDIIFQDSSKLRRNTQN